jgi:hypothetical protein
MMMGQPRSSIFKQWCTYILSLNKKRGETWTNWFESILKGKMIRIFTIIFYLNTTWDSLGDFSHNIHTNLQWLDSWNISRFMRYFHLRAPLLIWDLLGLGFNLYIPLSVREKDMTHFSDRLIYIIKNDLGFTCVNILMSILTSVRQWEKMVFESYQNSKPINWFCNKINTEIRFWTYWRTYGF